MSDLANERRKSARNPWQRPLDLLGATPGVVGAVLLTRDGLPVLTQFERLRRPETFVAMAAATLTACEVMSREVNLHGPILFQVDHPKLSFAGMSASEDLVIVAFATPDTDLRAAFERVREESRSSFG